MPEVSADFRTWTVRVRPGIFFADDPAFKGKRRELVAAGLRLLAQALRRPGQRRARSYSTCRTTASSASRQLRERSAARRAAVRLRQRGRGPARARPLHAAVHAGEPRPRFVDDAGRRRPARRGGARGGRALRRPRSWRTRSAPARSGWSSWRRSSLIVLERNPALPRGALRRRAGRRRRRGPGLARALQGPARCRSIDGVEVSIIEEEPAALAGLPERPGRRWSRGADRVRRPRDAERQAGAEPRQARHPGSRKSSTPTSRCRCFNMEDPVVGGYTPDKVALRRAIEPGLRHRAPRSASSARGQAIPAQSPMPPRTSATTPAFKSENERLRPGARQGAARPVRLRRPRRRRLARAARRRAAGAARWRRRPDSIERQFDENWQKNLDAIGVRIRFDTAQWPENLKAARAGKLQMWRLGSTAADARRARRARAACTGRRSAGQN